MPSHTTLNGTPLAPGDRVTVLRAMDRGFAAWVNGVRLAPGDRLERDGVLWHVEPAGEFRDPTLRENQI